MGRHYTYETTLCIDGENDIDVKVSFTVSWGHPGCWYQRNGDPGFPPEPSEIDDITVETINGHLHPIAAFGTPATNLTAEAIERKLREEHSDAMIQEAAEADAAEHDDAEERRWEEFREGCR